MALAMWFWLLMFLWLIFGFVGFWPTADRTWRGYAPLGTNLLLFLVLLILGLETFGSPIK